MLTLNQTPFKFALIAGRLSYPKHSLTLIVKGTFDVAPGGKATIAQEQAHPTGDEFYPDDDVQMSGCRYESDFSYFKPKADLLLVGKCCAPQRKPVPACQVIFKVGTMGRSLMVLGARYWKRSFLRSTMTTPEPFAEMELRYENSFGGAKYKNNPMGKGFSKQLTVTGEWVHPLPNIENPNALIDSPRSRPEPASFGPLGRMWGYRHAKMGTYKGNYLEERWPWFPKDFDWTHFNAAPEVMQVDGYLRGDEELYFENLHPEHARYKAYLPGLKVRCFLNERAEASNEGMRFRAVTMNLDTLWVDMEAERLVLVWRGTVNVGSEDYEEVEHAFIISESVDEPAKPLNHYRQLFTRQLAESEAEWELETLGAEAAEIEKGEVAASADQEEADTDREEEEAFAEAEAGVGALLAELGIAPENPPSLSEEAEKEKARILKEITAEEEEKKEKEDSSPLTREVLQERISKGDSFCGEDLRGLDLSGLEMREIDFSEAVFAGVALKDAILAGANLRDANLAGANLSGANLTTSDLAGADLSGANLKKACLREADLSEACLVGADLSCVEMQDAILEKAALDNALLDEVKAIDAIFSEANLTGTSLKGSTLDGADFSKCILNQANFEGSTLREASVEGAVGVKINMAETDLTELRASEGCDFSEGSFRKAEGLESIWDHAQLSGCDFSYADMEGADFTKATLEGANFYAANMQSSRFISANLRDAKLVEMNLFEGSLEKADLSGADLSGSNMYAVEFLEAETSQCRAQNTNLKMTKLHRG